MPRTARYYPARIGDQIVWLRNFRNKIGTYQTALGYSADDITAAVADCDRMVWLLDTLQGAASGFGQAVTAHVRLVFNGPGSAAVPPPTFSLPATPAPPANVVPGAQKRLFAFIKNLKTRTAYTVAIGQDLGVIGEEVTEDPDETPKAKAAAKSGEVILNFNKAGHLGVWIESQVANETEWTFLAIDTSDPYNDTRPLKVAGQPEKRRYRLCFWDGEPTRVWTPVIEVVFGG